MADDLQLEVRGDISVCLCGCGAALFPALHLEDKRDRGRIARTVSVTSRRADWNVDSEALMKFLWDHLSTSIGAERFDWLYRRGPAGAARGWLAVDEKE